MICEDALKGTARATKDWCYEVNGVGCCQISDVRDSVARRVTKGTKGHLGSFVSGHTAGALKFPVSAHLHMCDDIPVYMYLVSSTCTLFVKYDRSSIFL